MHLLTPELRPSLPALYSQERTRAIVQQIAKSANAINNQWLG
jgi:hypothetical protein